MLAKFEQGFRGDVVALLTTSLLDAAVVAPPSRNTKAYVEATLAVTAAVFGTNVGSSLVTIHPAPSGVARATAEIADAVGVAFGIARGKQLRQRRHDALASVSSATGIARACAVHAHAAIVAVAGLASEYLARVSRPIGTAKTGTHHAFAMAVAIVGTCVLDFATNTASTG